MAVLYFTSYVKKSILFNPAGLDTQFACHFEVDVLLIRGTSGLMCARARLIKIPLRSGIRIYIAETKIKSKVEEPILRFSRTPSPHHVESIHHLKLKPRLNPRTRPNRLPTPNRPLNKMAPLPPINLIKARLSNQLIPSHLRQNHRPHNPVNASTSNNPPTHHTMQVVRQRLIHGNSVCRRHERRNHEVDVAGEEEDRHWQRGAEGRVPVVFLAVRVQPDEAEGYEGVYYCKGVGDYAFGRRVSVSAWVSRRLLGRLT
jgi:hypothetical protein